MRLGYELIKEQLFFRKELVERVAWFVRLRWIAIFAGLVCSRALILFQPTWPIRSITVILAGLLVVNALFQFCCRVLDRQEPLHVEHYILFAHIQIVIDLAALFGLIHLTGGLQSPFLLFTIFHIILAGILLSPASSFIYGGLVIVWVTLQMLPAIGKNFPNHFTNLDLSTRNRLLNVLIFCAVILITAVLTTTLKVSLRKKGRELLSVSKELDNQNIKLTALYHMVEEMGSYSELKKLLDGATRKAALIMGVKACSIKLLDEQHQQLTFASTYGLSEQYLSKGTIDIAKSPINQKIIQGSVYAIGHIDEKTSFQFPENLESEGIASVVCLPMRVEKRIFGVFCVYSREPDFFQTPDIDFFSMMCDLTALAIENMRNELNKTWFMRKAAHQLKSPSVAIYSMLKTLTDGYLGPLLPEQTATLDRCEKRLKMQRELIDTLLDLSIKRSTLATCDLHPVDPVNIIHSLVNTYASHADEKGINLSFASVTNIPLIMADENLLDDLFGNLLSNALKYTPRAGTVTIRLSIESNGRVCCTVADTGIGIASEDIPHLFSEFFRAPNAKAFDEGGNGLGLVIIKEIVDRLQGSVSVTSRVGQGTSFAVSFPPCTERVRTI